MTPFFRQMLVSRDWYHRCESVSNDPIHVRRIPVGEGRRVETFAQLLSPAAADSPSFAGAHPAAADTPAENDWRVAIEARLASLESEIAELKAGQTRDSAM